MKRNLILIGVVFGILIVSLVTAFGPQLSPPVLGSWSYCSSTNKCGHGEGDCDGVGSYRHCLGGTICVRNVGSNYGWASGVDVCECKNGKIWDSGSNSCISPSSSGSSDSINQINSTVVTLYYHGLALIENILTESQKASLEDKDFYSFIEEDGTTMTTIGGEYKNPNFNCEVVCESLGQHCALGISSGVMVVKDSSTTETITRDYLKGISKKNCQLNPREAVSVNERTS